MKQLAFRVDRIRVPDAKTAQRVTIDLIAKCIRNAQSYLPIRNLAASVAARAAPKDYLGQLKAIYDDFLIRWRYVKDPVGVETLAASPRAVFYLVLNADGRGAGGGMGVGDCDDAACAIGSELSAIGMPVRIATTRNPGSTRGLFSHIFIQARVPGHGWISVDPVGHPLHGFAWTPPHSAIATWDVYGQQIAGDRLIGAGGEVEMQYHGFGALGRAEDYKWEEYPMPATAGEPLPWDVYGLSGFGCYADTMGMIGDGRGYMVEVDEDNEIGNTGLVRTPMLELAPGPFELVNRFGIVLDGTLALGDDGTVYEYDGFDGFFKKFIIKRAKRRIKKLTKPVLRGVEKLVGKTKAGRKIIKLKNKIAGVSLKILKPLLGKMGRWAPALAPVAALIPGVGPIISSYMISVGGVARLADKHGVEWIEFVKTDKRTGRKTKSTKLAGKPKDIRRYRKALKKAGKKYKGLSRRKLEAGVARLKAYKGPGLPRADLTRKKLLKRGSPQWKSALQAIGLRAGAFRVGQRRKASTIKMGAGAIRKRSRKGLPKRQRFITRRKAITRATIARRRAQLRARPTRRAAITRAAMAARRRAQLRARPTRRVRVKRLKTAAERRRQRRALPARRPVKMIRPRPERAARRASRRAAPTRRGRITTRRRAA